MARRAPKLSEVRGLPSGSRSARDRALDAAAQARRDNLYASTAAKRAGTTVATMRRYLGDAVYRDPLGRWDVRGSDPLAAVMGVPTPTGAHVPVTVRGASTRRALGQLHSDIKTLGATTSLPGDRTDAEGRIRALRGRRFGGVTFNLTPERILTLLAQGKLKLPDSPYPERRAA